MFDETKIYSITFTDGTVISDLSVNGDNFISKTLIDPSVFAIENCYGIIINDGEKDETHKFMTPLISGEIEEGTFWFAMFDAPVPPEPDMTVPQLQADIEYIAMMTGVELY